MRKIFLIPVKYMGFSSYMAAYWKQGLLVAFLNIAVSALYLAGPFLAKLAVDKAYAGKDLRLFFLLMLAMGGIFILANALNALISYISRYVELKINFALSKKIFSKLNSLSYPLFHSDSSAKHLYNISYDIGCVTHLLSNSIPQVIFCVPRFILILAVIFYLQKTIALAFLVLLPLSYLFLVRQASLLKQKTKDWVESSQYNFERAQEMLYYNQLIKVFATQRREMRGFVSRIIKNIRLSLSASQRNMAVSLASSIVQRALVGLLVFYGGFQVIKGSMSLGTFSAIALYLGQLAQFHAIFAGSFHSLSLGLVSCERLQDVLDKPGDQASARIMPKIRLSSGAVGFENVSFGYEPDKDVLKSVSFYIESGSFVALAGPSGCGKTTIVNLLLRLYEPASGKILVDGKTIDGMDVSAYLDQIAAVLQEPMLWSDTVFNNISYGKKGASKEEVRWAARLAGADEFIGSLKHGYDTFIGEHAYRLSEGQKQRLAVARALIKKPRILVLDEGLSSVDAHAEEKIIKGIRAGLKETTVILISHRLCSILAAEKVCFISAADKLVTGTHQQLMRDNPGYQEYLAWQEKQ